MIQPVLSDKNIYPADEVIFSHIGKAGTLWISFFDYLHTEHPDMVEEWRYYNDGKSWLMKVQRKTKTIFWLSLAEKTFRTTFYFPRKAEQLIMESPIPGELKEQFSSGNKDAKIHGITVYFKNKKDIEHAKELCKLKLSIK